MILYIFLVISALYTFGNNASEQRVLHTLSDNRPISIRNIDNSSEDTIEIAPPLLQFDIRNVQIFNSIINTIKSDNNQARLWTGKNSWLHKAFEAEINPLRRYDSSGGQIFLFYKYNDDSKNKTWHISLKKESTINNILPETENLKNEKEKLINLNLLFCKEIPLNTHGETPLCYAFRRNDFLLKKKIFREFVYNIHNNSTDKKLFSFVGSLNPLFRDQFIRYRRANNKYYPLIEIDSKINNELKKLERYAYPVINSNYGKEQGKIPFYSYITGVGLLEEISEFSEYIYKKIKKKDCIAFLNAYKIFIKANSKQKLPKPILNMIISKAYPPNLILYCDFFNFINGVIKSSKEKNVQNSTSGIFSIDESYLKVGDTELMGERENGNARYDEEIFIPLDELNTLKDLADKIKEDETFKDILKSVRANSQKIMN